MTDPIMQATQHKSLQRVLIMAGGTGGHIFPGLAIAHYLREQGLDVHWLGTTQGMEARLVPEANFPLHMIDIGGLRGKGIKTLLTAPLKITAAVWQALKVMKTVKPDVVIGLGGFVSGPGGIASWITGRPLIIHEQNAKAGSTNKILSLFAKRILEGFPSAFKPGARVVTIGNPVRSEIANLPPPDQRLDAKRKPLRLLVLGGSLGAQALNDIVPRMLSKLIEAERPQVLHQTGDKHFAAAKIAYESMQIQADLKPFIKDMANAYGWADVVLCRAGALTVAELSAVGLGAIFVPFPHAVDDHQTVNAQYMVRNQAALCIQQSELTADKLADIVKQFVVAPQKCIAMAEAAYELRKINVVEQVYDICKEVCR